MLYVLIPQKGQQILVCRCLSTGGKVVRDILSRFRKTFPGCRCTKLHPFLLSYSERYR